TVLCAVFPQIDIENRRTSRTISRFHSSLPQTRALEHYFFCHLRKVKTGVLKIQLSNHLPRPVSQDYNYTNTPRFIQSFLLFLFIAAALYLCVILSPIISVLTIMSINLLMRFSSL
ncbi:hypothetical protein GBAR_LOCUS27678, partial [Geodia barretti]